MLRCCDVFDMLGEVPDESVDLVLTDLPYESLEKYRKIGTTTRLKKSKSSNNDWFKIFHNSKFEDLFREFYRVLKNNTHLYMFCDFETSFIMKPIGEEAGFKFWKPIIWDKEKIGMGYHYRAKYEMIMFFEKGKNKLNDLSIPDVLRFPRINRGYPTEKPVDLCEVFIKQSTEEGNVVLDPFMGSGSVGVAAIKNKRKFIGCDISLKALNLSKERINEIRRDK